MKLRFIVLGGKACGDRMWLVSGEHVAFIHVEGTGEQSEVRSTGPRPP